MADRVQAETVQAWEAQGPATALAWEISVESVAEVVPAVPSRCRARSIARALAEVGRVVVRLPCRARLAAQAVVATGRVWAAVIAQALAEAVRVAVRLLCQADWPPRRWWRGDVARSDRPSRWRHRRSTRYWGSPGHRGSSGYRIVRVSGIARSSVVGGQGSAIARSSEAATTGAT